MNREDSDDRISFIGEDNTYIIHSKEGYTNIRKGPSKQYDIIKKIPNDYYAAITQDFGEWKYIMYFEGGLDKVGYGFVHKSQLKLSQ